MIDVRFKRHDNPEKVLELCGRGPNPVSLSDDPLHIFQSPYGRNFVGDPKDARSPLSGILREATNFLKGVDFGRLAWLLISRKRSRSRVTDVRVGENALFRHF